MRTTRAAHPVCARVLGPVVAAGLAVSGCSSGAGTAARTRASTERAVRATFSRT